MCEEQTLLPLTHHIVQEEGYIALCSWRGWETKEQSPLKDVGSLFKSKNFNLILIL
jgi:hypothetical protein